MTRCHVYAVIVHEIIIIHYGWVPSRREITQTLQRNVIKNKKQRPSNRDFIIDELYYYMTQCELDMLLFCNQIKFCIFGSYNTRLSAIASPCIAPVMSLVHIFLSLATVTISNASIKLMQPLLAWRHSE